MRRIEEKCMLCCKKIRTGAEFDIAIRSTPIRDLTCYIHDSLEATGQVHARAKKNKKIRARSNPS
jgi:hypothetical protein